MQEWDQADKSRDAPVLSEYYLVGMFMSIRCGHCFPRNLHNTSARKIYQTKAHEDANKNKYMQEVPETCNMMHKIECSKSKTISRMAERFLLFLWEGSNGKGWNICTVKKISEEVIATTHPWEPPCLCGGTAGPPCGPLCRAEHAKLQNMRRWFERIIVGS
jgi:hypothetical protein